MNRPRWGGLTVNQDVIGSIPMMPAVIIGCVAQWLERLVVNQRVEGSNPSVSSNLLRRVR